MPNQYKSRNALKYMIREARKAGILLSNALLSAPPTTIPKKPRRPHRYIKGVYKGNFVKKRIPIRPQPTPTVPKLPPLGPQTMPQPLKHSMEQQATASSSSLSHHHASSASSNTSNTTYSRMYNWWKQNAAVLILNFGSLCTLTGFVRSDVLELRAFSMTGSLSSVAYFVLTAPTRYAPILWSSLFATVNGVKIYQILYERNAKVVLSEREEEIFVEHFMPSGVTPKQFETVISKARILQIKKGDVIVKQGDALEHVYLVVKGKTRANYMGRKLTAVSSAPGHRTRKEGGDAGAWIGEMTFLEQLHAPINSRLTGRAIYTIVAQTDCEVLVWSFADIEALLKSSTDLRASMTRAMTAPIVGKVINFTVSMGNSRGWTSWLNDWKNSGENTQVVVEQKEEGEEQLEELEPVM
jgi:hypothetical protein